VILETIRRATRNERLVGEAVAASGGQDLYLFAFTAEGVTARMFDSEFGIGEDPATGSAAGPLGAYLAEYGGLGKDVVGDDPSGESRSAGPASSMSRWIARVVFGR
jgi:predicted PhzF superfamily epimerase YddE/YHI9